MYDKLEDLIILAGGKGTRVFKQLKGKPKPLLNIGKISILERLLNHYSKNCFRKIFIITGFRGQQIKKKFHNKFFNFNKVTCLQEFSPHGTGGYIVKNIKKFTKNFFIINADSFCDLDFHNFQKKKINNNLGKIVLVENNAYKKNKKLNNLKINYQNKICFTKSKKSLMNGGIYYLNNRCFKKKFLTKEISLEDDIITPLINKKKIIGYKTNGFFLDIGTPKNLKKADKLFRNNLLKPALFLDRDGTINEDIGYLHDFKKFKLKKNIVNLIKYFVKKKYLLFIITNQAGLAKKKFSFDQFVKFTITFKKFFRKYQIYFDDIIFCPYHENGTIKKYKKKSLYRKPGNLMIKYIFDRWYINKKKSLFIGDQKKDELCSKKSNIKFYYYSEELYNKIRKF